MSDILNFEESDNIKFVKRNIRKRFNAEEQFETIQKQLDKIGETYIKLTTAYIRNNIFGIIRQSNLFYDAATKLISDITMLLKENHNQIPKETRQSYIKYVNSIEKFVSLLQQAKNDWAVEYAQSNDPDFDMLIKQGEEKFADIFLRIAKTNHLDKFLSNRDTSVPKF